IHDAAHSYDLFQIFRNGEYLWRGCVETIEEAKTMVERIARTTPNEVFAQCLATGRIVARANASSKAADRDDARALLHLFLATLDRLFPRRKNKTARREITEPSGFSDRVLILETYLATNQSNERDQP